MIPVLLSVIAVSFAGAIAPGSVTAVALAKSYKSPWVGFQVALAHVIIDILVILLIYFGISRFFQNSIVQFVPSILGGTLVIWLGINMFRVRYAVANEGKDLRYSSFVLSVITTIFNPMFLLWWAI